VGEYNEPSVAPTLWRNVGEGHEWSQPPPPPPPPVPASPPPPVEPSPGPAPPGPLPVTRLHRRPTMLILGLVTLSLKVSTSVPSTHRPSPRCRP
jgi:hypothetical protein